jgi:carboxyl-terminal processing protease
MSPPTAEIPADASAPSNFALFNEVWGIVNREFYWERTAPSELTYGAVDGMVEAIADPYSGFLNRKEVASLRAAPGPDKVSGVGLFVESGYAGALVVSSVAGSPADRAGLRAGDVLLAAGDTPFEGANRGTISSALSGKPGTSVVVTVYRHGEQPFPVELVRDTFDPPVLEVRRLEPGVEYLRIAEFSPDLPDQLDKALADVEASAPSAVVIDLRDNPGGEMEAFRHVASRFVRGPLYSEVDNHGQRDVVSQPDVRPAHLPDSIIVIVNDGTASAAEMLAALLRERLDAKLVGHTTFGKSTIQGLIPLSDGSFLRLTVGRWQSPGGESVADGGLEPDRALEAEEDPVEVARELAVQRAAASR